VLLRAERLCFLNGISGLEKFFLKERAPLQLVWDLGFGVLDVAVAR